MTRPHPIIPASGSPSPRVGWPAILTLLNVVLSGFILMLWGVPRWAGVPATRAAAAAEMPAATPPAEPRAAAIRTPPATARAEMTMPAPRRAERPRPIAPTVAAGTTGGVTVTAQIPPALRADPLTILPGQRAADMTPPAIATAGEDGVTMPERLPESHVRPTIAALPGGTPVTGDVTLRAIVRADGTVQQLDVLSTSRPGAGLEEAALTAVRQWRYKPATRDGQPVDARLTIIVTFR